MPSQLKVILSVSDCIWAREIQPKPHQGALCQNSDAGNNLYFEFLCLVLFRFASEKYVAHGFICHTNVRHLFLKLRGWWEEKRRLKGQHSLILCYFVYMWRTLPPFQLLTVLRDLIFLWEQLVCPLWISSAKLHSAPFKPIHLLHSNPNSLWSDLSDSSLPPRRRLGAGRQQHADAAGGQLAAAHPAVWAVPAVQEPAARVPRAAVPPCRHRVAAAAAVPVRRPAEDHLPQGELGSPKPGQVVQPTNKCVYY